MSAMRGRLGFSNESAETEPSITHGPVSKYQSTFMSVRALLLLFVVTAKLSCQVSVEVKTSKPDYLAGEAVFVVLEVRNVGTEPVAYWRCEAGVDLLVKGAKKKQVPNLWGCFAGEGGGVGCGTTSHPPFLEPGKTVTFQYLLKDYRLGPGRYELRAKGTAGVRWKQPQVIPSGASPPSPPQHKEGDAVEGAEFEVSLPLKISSGSLDDLQQAYAPLVTQADGHATDIFAMEQAREAIVEMAPEFLESTIAGFASPPRPTALAVKGLENIATPESRADLLKIYDSNPDPGLRARIVEALAKIGAPDDLQFLAGLLPASGAYADRSRGQWAALGLGHIGGDSVVAALASGFSGSDEEVRHAIVLALGNTESSSAVDSLIGMYSDGDDLVRNDVCSALSELTHRLWCDGSGSSVTTQQARWRKWWSSHKENAVIYGKDDCPSHLLELGAD